MSNRYVLIDPTGANVVCEPVEEPIVLDPSTLLYSGSTTTGKPITGASEALFNFSFACDLDEPEAKALEALARWQQTTGRETEIVAYYVFDLFTERGTTPTREGLPDIPPQVNEDNNTVSYYPVIQGDVVVTSELLGLGSSGLPRYRVNVNFIEGTIRRP